MIKTKFRNYLNYLSYLVKTLSLLLQFHYILISIYSKVQNTKSSFYKMQILEITKYKIQFLENAKYKK